jgi:hypothetical protein
MVEPGALIDCLNYEVTDTAGYKRIDGYEKYDGYPNGALYEFYRFHITAVDSGNQSKVAVGAIISRIGDAGKTDIGVIVGNAGGDYYDVVPRDSLDSFIIDEQFLVQYNGGGFILLASEAGLLKIKGTPDPLGDEFVITALDGSGDFDIEVDSTPIPGREIITDPTAYIEQIRTYSAVLRTLVQDAPGDIAGLYWFEDRLICAVDALRITLTLTHGAATPPLGTRMRWNGMVYRLAYISFVQYQVNDYWTVVLYPLEPTTDVDDDLVEIDTLGSTINTWVTDVTINGTPLTHDSDYAVLGYFNNPNTDPDRGFTYMTPAVSFNYDAGLYTGDDFAPPLTIDASIASNTEYYLINVGEGVATRVYLSGITQTTGDFMAGTAEGWAQIVVGEVVAGARDYAKDNDEIHNAYPTTGSSRVLTINGDVSSINIAGTRKLASEGGTRYQWGTFNFYGQSSTLSAYGVTGAGRGFWANKTGYGQIRAIDDDLLDKPKYLSFHGNRLVLGYKKGAVLFSVPGEAYNFSGLDGAIEQDTGDDITGLLELPGDTLAVFGRRTIRSITGFDSNDMQLKTISGNTGAFDYTVHLVGANAVFTNATGVTTLDQSADYGDFIGRRLSDKISNWLRPKLSKTGRTIEDGGVLLAYVVRSKNQYRLVLKTGEHIVFTLLGDDIAITFSNYSFLNSKRVPAAISTEVSVDGQEHVHVAWDDDNLLNQVFELETGWGFNGAYFQNYFDVAHLFLTNSASNFGIEKARLYGRGYGIATLDIKTASVEDGFTQDFYESTQIISMPRKPELLYTRAQPVTGIIDTASWGLGTKIRIQGSNPVNSTKTEPSHTCQVLVLQVRSEGAQDD